MQLLWYTVFLVFFSHCKCEEWWENSQIYQVYVRSFKDSDGDGIGDINGIRKELNYFSKIKADVLLLSSIYESPRNVSSIGYDVRNYFAISPEYGTIDDFKKLIQEAKAKGISIILDFVPNHTTNDCDWFLKSVKKDPKYKDYYIWHDGKVSSGIRVPPSNWKSIYGNPMWELNEERNQFYLHQFSTEQPDLNFRNPDVLQEISNALKFWLELGVAGFSIDSVSHLVEVADTVNVYPDEPSTGYIQDPTNYDFLEHIYTRDQSETFEIVNSWRSILDNYTEVNKVPTRLLIVDVNATIETAVKYYGNKTHEGAHFPLNYELTFINKEANAGVLEKRIKTYLNSEPKGRVANWVTGTHNYLRITDRYGEQLSQGIIMVQMLLPGILVTYQGEEIGMMSHPNIKTTDRVRTPFQWSFDTNAGFSTNESTWVTIPDNYIFINLKKQEEADNSVFKIYNQLLSIRKTVKDQKDVVVETLNSDVLFVKRTFEKENYIVLINTNDTGKRTDLSELYPHNRIKVAWTSLNSRKTIGEEIDPKNIYLDPHESILLRNNAMLSNVSNILLLLLIAYNLL